MAKICGGGAALGATFALGVVALLAACSAPDHPSELSTIGGIMSGHMTRPPPFMAPSGAPMGTATMSGGCEMVTGGCTDIKSCGQKVVVQTSGAAAPTSSGGTIADGTYVLTDATLYTGTGGNTKMPTNVWFKQTLRITTAPPGWGADAASEAGLDVWAEGSSDLSEASGDDGGATVAQAEASVGPPPSGGPQLLEELSESDSQALGSESGTIASDGAHSLLVNFDCPPMGGGFSATYSASNTSLAVSFPETINGAPETLTVTFTKM